MSKVIGVTIDGVLEWHASNNGPTDYTTMCGVDADDPSIGHTGTTTAKRGQRITCRTCHGIWTGVTSLRLRERDFDPALSRSVQ